MTPMNFGANFPEEDWSGDAANSKKDQTTKDETADAVPALHGGAQAEALAERVKIEKRLKLKLDCLLLPLIFLIYVLNYLDRNSISQARLSGLEDDLGLSDTQYQTSIMSVFIFYILLQVPSNMMLAWCGKPSLYLGTFICLWGTVSACTGAVQSFGGLVAVRLLLGATEAPFFPGALYLLSKWYTRTELSVRMALLYAASLFSNAVAGLIAAGVLGNMEGVHGIRAWRWLFILIGAITVGCGFLIMLILPDFPHSTKKWFFTEEELNVAVQRLEEDAGSSDVEGQGEDGNTPFKGFVLAVKDPKVWMLTFMLFAAVTGLAFNAFFPSLVKTLGYGKIETLLLTTPPWAWAFICVYLNALHADKTGERFWHLTVPLIFGIVGFIIDSTTLKTGARFFGMFICASSYAGFTTMLTWASNTIPRPAYKRAAALAIINCVSNAGNIAGSYIWPSAWGPSYWRSNLISACCFVVAIFMALVLKIHLTKLNKELDRINGEVDKATPDPLQASGDIESDKVLNDAERVALAKRNFRYLK